MDRCRLRRFGVAPPVTAPIFAKVYGNAAPSKEDLVDRFPHDKNFNKYLTTLLRGRVRISTMNGLR